MNPEDIPEIDVATARERRDEAVFLDVREPDEWEAGHLDGAVHIPLGSLGAELHRLSTDTPIVAVCRVGGRSAQATHALRSAGYDVTNMAGGMKAWAAAGFDVVDDAGRPGTVV